MNRKLHVITLILVGFTLLGQVPKTILVEHFTNTNCPICSSRNPSFYSNFKNQKNAIHIAFHPSSPYATCFFSMQNPKENDDRAKYYNAYGGTPRFVLNGVESFDQVGSSSYYDAVKDKTSPFSITIEQSKVDSKTIQAKIIIKKVSVSPVQENSLFVAIAEDTINYRGGNGEPVHYDVFRKTISNILGDKITLPVNIGQSLELRYSSAVSASWDINRIFLVVALQNNTTKEVLQAAASKPKDNFVITNNFDLGKDNIELQISPNPAFSSISLGSNIINSGYVEIYNMFGKKVLSQDVSLNSSSIDISMLPKGIYSILLKDNKLSKASKFLKL